MQNGDGDDDELESAAAPEEEEDQLEPVVCDEPTALAEQVAQEGAVEQVLHPKHNKKLRAIRARCRRHRGAPPTHRR